MKTLTAFLFVYMPLALSAAPQAGSQDKPEPSGNKTAMTAPKSAEAAAKSGTAIDPAKEAAIRKLFDVQGTRDAMRQVIAGMATNMKPILESSLPAGEYRSQLIELFLQKFQTKLSVDQLVELALPVYDKHFSLEDINGLTKFYETPLGKKAISVLPQVLLETQAAGSKLGEQVGRESMMEVLNEHPELKKSLEDASAQPNNP